MNIINAPTTVISTVLDYLIRPLFDKYARSTAIVDGSDLICRLHDYAVSGYLYESTELCTFDIINLYSMRPQEKSPDALCEFLSCSGYTQVKGIPIDAIRTRAHILLIQRFCL
jgi:hypothetical protein